MAEGWASSDADVRDGRLCGWAPGSPEREVLSFVGGPTFTSHGLWNAVSRRADELTAAGMRRGHRLCLVQENTPDFVLDLLAAFRLGVVVAPINTALRGMSLTAVVEDLTPCIVRIGPGLRPVIQSAVEELADVILWPTDGAIDRPVTWPADPDAGSGPPHESDLAVILFSSGTTGLPKGVMWPHAMALAAAEHTTWVMGYEESDTIYTCLPLFHINALFCALYSGLLVGARVVVAPRFSANSFWSEIEACHATTTTMMGAIPAILWRRDPAPHERRHRLRIGMVLPLPAERSAFEERFGFPTTEVYGSTDTGIPLGIPFGTSRPGSCGVATPGWEAAVVDEHDQPVADGHDGELVVRPRRPHLGSAGYWRRPEATVSATRNLWFHTGDVVVRDDGWFTYRGRGKDMIRVSGENVAPILVESALLRHPAVLEAAAFGLPSPRGEEAVAAVVVLRPGADLVMADLRLFVEPDLPYFAVPRYLGVTKVLPKTATSKVVKTELRARGNTDLWDGGQSRRRPPGVGP